jgi:hypothetical protein
MASTQLRHVGPQATGTLEACLEAGMAAEDCLDLCLDEDGQAIARATRLCRDVADLTTLTARLMARGSPAQPYVAAACADVCETCADELAAFDHEHFAWCAEVLREAAEAARQLSGGGPREREPTAGKQDDSPFSGYF